MSTLVPVQGTILAHKSKISCHEHLFKGAVNEKISVNGEEKMVLANF